MMTVLAGFNMIKAAKVAVITCLILGLLVTAAFCVVKQGKTLRQVLLLKGKDEEGNEQEPQEEEEEETTTRTRILTDDDLLQIILSYLPKSYRFVAPVSKRFQRNYLVAHGGKKKTSEGTAVQSAATAHIWLHEADLRRKITPFGGPCEIAARYGSLEALQYLRSKGRNWSPWTCHYAASRGNLEMLQWAIENGCDWTTWTCASAAKNGRLKELQWLRDNDCPWDQFTCIEAAENGHLEALQWAVANGCDWDPNQILRLGLGLDKKVFAWIMANR